MPPTNECSTCRRCRADYPVAPSEPHDPGFTTPRRTAPRRRRRGRCALLLAACGDDGDEGDEAAGSAAGPVHVHGLGVNPEDEALFVATHTGLFRSPAGSSSAERVDDQFQDTMGFTVVGPDHFLGSGHPAPGEDRPPNLGLIESTDGGQSWEELSLAGEADFHVLRLAHDRVYAYNVLSGELMLSADGGETWTTRRPPAPLIDLAVDPRDSRARRRLDRGRTGAERGRRAPLASASSRHRPPRLARAPPSLPDRRRGGGPGQRERGPGVAGARRHRRPAGGAGRRRRAGALRRPRRRNRPSVRRRRRLLGRAIDAVADRSRAGPALAPLHSSSAASKPAARSASRRSGKSWKRTTFPSRSVHR